MRGSKKNAVPAGGFISLGPKSKRQATSSPAASNVVSKKSKTDFVEVDAKDLVQRTETALDNGDLSSAQSFVLSALNQLSINTSTSVSSFASGAGFRPSSGSPGSRLAVGFSLGLLVLARSHPTLFSHPDVMNMMTSLMIPANSTATANTRIKGLRVFVANLIYFAMESQTKWPSDLVKMYFDDSLTDRNWVDQDECRLFVLNLETAFPKAYGNPRGLFTILSSSLFSSPFMPTSSSSHSGGAGNQSAIHAVLGLTGTTRASTTTDSSTSKDEIAEAVSSVLQSQPTSVAELVHGADYTSRITPRFETYRKTLEPIILSRLRDTLNPRHHGASGPSTTLAGISLASSVSNPISSSAVSSGGDTPHWNSYIRTLAMAVGMPETRSLATGRFESWLGTSKLQNYMIGLLALMATNCRLGGISPHDVDVMITFIYRIHYKLLKPSYQMAYFECFAHLVSAAQTNLYTMLHLSTIWELRSHQGADSIESKTQTNKYVTQAIVRISESVRSMVGDNSGDSTLKLGLPSQHQAETITMTAVAANAASVIKAGSGCAFCLLPYLYHRFPTRWIRIMGNMLHDQLIHIATSSSIIPRDEAVPLSDDQVCLEASAGLDPAFRFLRELARLWRSSLPEAYATLAVNGTVVFFPCAELAGALLRDRNHRGSMSVLVAATSIIDAIAGSNGAKGHIASFQLYLNGLVLLINAVQMVSIYRPEFSVSARRPAHSYDAMKLHQVALRQIRLGFIRWTKTIFPSIVNAAIKSLSTSTNEPDSSAVLLCFEALRPAILIRRALMLQQSTHPIHKPAPSLYELSPTCYPVRGIWNSETDQSPLAKLVMDVCLPEKLTNQLLVLGLEPSWQLLSPLDAVDIVCELTWRAAFLADETGLETLMITQTETLIDLMYKSCTFISERPVPDELTGLAHSSLYWKVCFTAVVLAAYCPRTCGLHLWTEYPTVRYLMEMAIKRDFALPTESPELDQATVEVIQSEHLNAQLEIELILRLESLLLNADADESCKIVVTPESSKLLGRLVSNNPRGPCRLPPPDQLNLFQELAEKMTIGRRLWRSRDPDFLLELVRCNSSHATVQPWLARLVESSGSEIEFLPIQCLCEYLVCDVISQLHIKQHWALPIPLSLDKTLLSIPEHSNGINGASEPDSVNRIEQLTRRLQEEMRTFSHQAAADALAMCFFTRLGDLRWIVRDAVRRCLQALVIPGQAYQPTLIETTMSSWLQVLQKLSDLPALRTAPQAGTSSLSPEALLVVLNAVLSSIVVETDLDILTASLLFLAQIAFDTALTWRTVVSGVTEFILGRQSILQRLLHRTATDSSLDMGLASLEALAEIFVRYVEYTCTAAEAIPVDEKKSVFVVWSSDRQCPLELDCIQAQLILLSHIRLGLPASRPPWLTDLLDLDGSMQRSCSWLRLKDVWCIPAQTMFCLPSLSPLVFPMPSDPTTTSKALTFEASGGESRTCLSAALRLRFIRTNQRPLVALALSGCTSEELLNILPDLDLSHLNPPTIDLLIKYLHGFSGNAPDCQAAIAKLEQQQVRHADPSTYSRPTPMEVSITEETSPEAPMVSQPVHVLQSLSGQTFWTHLLERLSCLDEVEQSELICEALASASEDPKTASLWRAQLFEELSGLEQYLQNVLPTQGPISIGGATEFWSNVISNRSVVNLLEPLFMVCVLAEGSADETFKEELVSRVISLLDKVEHSEVICGVLSCISPSSCSESQRELTKAESLAEPSVSSKGSLLDNVCQFGLPELGRLLSAEVANQSTATDLVYQLVFSPTSSNASGDYLLPEFLNQFDPTYLHHCVRYLLSRSAVLTSNINYTRVLDFLMAVLTLPRLSYPVPRSEPRDRPDPFTHLVELLQLDVNESYLVCDYILGELMHLSEANQADFILLESCITKRLPLLDLAVTRWPRECIHHLEQYCLPSQADQLIHPAMAQRLVFRLYIRWPGIANLLCTETCTRMMRFPTIAPVDVTSWSLSHWPLMPINSLPHFEVDRVGPLILVGLSSGDKSVAGAARAASSALATHHPRLFLRLLPVLAALSEGHMELSWSQFSLRKCHFLFINLLRLLELLNDPPSNGGSVFPNQEDHDDRNSLLFSHDAYPYRNAIRQLLSNFIKMLVRYHTSARRLYNFPSRLARLLETYLHLAVWLTEEHSSDHGLLSPPVLDQIKFLSTEFDEFSPVLELMLLLRSTSQPSPQSEHSYLTQGLPLCTASVGKQSGKKLSLALLAPIIYQLQSISEPEFLLEPLEEVDEACQRKPELLLYFGPELERLLGHPSEKIKSVAIRLTLKLIKNYPNVSSGIVGRTLLPMLSVKSAPVTIPHNVILSALPDFCLSTPHLAPKLLRQCAQCVVFSSLDDQSRFLIDSVQESVKRLTLDCFDRAVTDYSSSSLVASKSRGS